MATPKEGAGGRIFRIGALSRERTGAPVVSSPDGAPPVSPEPKKPPTKKSLVQKLVGNLVLRVLAGVALANTAGYAAYQEIPAVHQLVDQQILERLGLKAPILPMFDNTKVKGVIDDRNTVPISSEKIKQLNLEPEFDLPSQTIKYLFPFKLPPGTTAIIDKTIRVKSGSDPTKLSVPLRETPLIIFSTKDVEIIAPADSHMGLFKGSKEYGPGGENPNSAVWLVLYHYDAEQDKTITWSITSTVGDQNGSFAPLFPMVDFFKEIIPGGKNNWESYPTVKKGTPIMKTTDADQAIDFRVKVYKGKVLDSSASSGTISPATHFLTSPSNEGEKLLTIQ